jgi:putative MATE family efflux protein
VQDTSEGTFPSSAPPPDSRKAVAPAVIDLLSTTVLIVFEGILLGRFSSAALAGGGMGLQSLFLVFTVILTFVMGASVPISRLVGAGKKDEADRLFSNAIGSVLGIGLIFALISLSMAGFIFRNIFGAVGDVETAGVGYFRTVAFFMPMIALNFSGTGILRATGDAFSAMMANLTANLLSAFLAIIFVFGYEPIGIPAMGAKGSALALGIGQTFGMIIFLRYVLSRKTAITLHLRDIVAPKWASIKRIVKIGLPVTAEQFFWMAGQIIIVAYIGRLGETSLAAHQIIIRLTQTLGVVYQGFAFGNMALCGRHIGADNEIRAILLSRKIRYISLAISIILGAIVYFNAEAIVHLFTFDPKVMELAIILIPILALQQIPKSQTMITTSELRARGDLIFIAEIAGITVAINIIGFSYIGVFVFGWGLPLIWVVHVLDEVVRYAIHLLRMRQRIVKAV